MTKPHHTVEAGEDGLTLVRFLTHGGRYAPMLDRTGRLFDLQPEILQVRGTAAAQAHVDRIINADGARVVAGTHTLHPKKD